MLSERPPDAFRIKQVFRLQLVVVVDVLANRLLCVGVAQNGRDFFVLNHGSPFTTVACDGIVVNFVFHQFTHVTINLRYLCKYLYT